MRQRPAVADLEPTAPIQYGVAVVRIAEPGYHRGWVPPNKGKTYPVEIFTPDEVRAIAAQCSSTSTAGIRHRALIVLLYRTGVWVSEALALPPSAVNAGSRER